MGKQHIILIGPSGVGKSSVAAALAARIGWAGRDSDAEVERIAGQRIAAIFAGMDEAAFRLLESGVIARAVQSPTPTVIAVGGGAVLDAANRGWMSEQGRIFYLSAKPPTILQRLRQVGLDERPLLSGDDPMARIEGQSRERGPLYHALAEAEFATDGLEVAGVVEQIVAYLSAHPAANISVGDWVDELRRLLGEERGRLRVIHDEGLTRTVWGRLAEFGREKDFFMLPSGEQAKSVAELSRIYDWLAGVGVERGETVVAIGGGASSDVAGFAAATYLRGLPLILVPTSLLAMVDAAIGGKTAVNLAAGKNLVGAFHQPHHIVIDPAWLRTLPPRDYASGWGEIVKYAIIEASIAGRAELLPLLEANAARLCQPPTEGDDDSLLRYVISRCAALKGQVVAGDEREREGGWRVLLNYGHTLAHALERATDYDSARLRHGEAVAIGMTAAATLAVQLGRCHPDLLPRQTALLQAYGLPTSWAHLGVRLEQVIAALSHDKKAKGGNLRWVLPISAPADSISSPTGGGGEGVRVALYDDVPTALAHAVIAGLGEPR